MISYSPFIRTQQTAEPFLRKHQLVAQREHLLLLQEYTKPEKNLTDENKKRGIVHHNTWESFTNDVKKFVDLLEEMAQNNNKTIVIFGHSLFLSAMLSYIGSSQKFMPTKKELHFRLPNCR